MFELLGFFLDVITAAQKPSYPIAVEQVLSGNSEVHEVVFNGYEMCPGENSAVVAYHRSTRWICTELPNWRRYQDHTPVHILSEEVRDSI